MKYECDMIRDLLPLCAEHMASEKSQMIVREHLAGCKDCAAEWEEIQQGTVPSVEVPEETRQYAKAAKRVKRKRARVLVGTVLATVLAIGLGTGAYVFGYCGGRLSAQRAAIAGLRKNHIENFDGYMLVFSPSNGKEKLCFMQCRDEESGKQTLLSTYTFKTAGCWFLGGIIDEMEFPAEPGVYAVTPPLNYDFYDCCYYYINDPAVQVLNITCGEQDYSMPAVLYPEGLCQFYIEHQFRQSQEPLTGTACDANGAVLYTLQDNTWTPVS